MQTRSAIEALQGWLAACDGIAVAVSGGVDSVTLATVAGRAPGGTATMFHAVSPAVQPEGTARVRALAASEGWRLQIVDAGEFGREEYRANPVDRCFYCKQSLYAAVARHTDRQVVSGANTDDLGEYRPGLVAAREAGVRHPYVELGIGKGVVRAMARALGLGALAELPASPCLSSRVETGVPIDAATLGRVHAVELAVRRRVDAANVRCRVRADGVVVEIDAPALEGLSAAVREAIAGEAGRAFGMARVALEPYRTGSAFLLSRSDGRARHPA